MGAKDIAFKNILADSDKFADLFNGTLFNGEEVLRGADFIDLPNESNIIVKNKKGKNLTMQRLRDVVKKVAYGAEFIILACESQTLVHYAMPIRNMLYDAITYTEQLQIITKQHKINNDYNNYAEIISGYKKDDNIVPIITLVIYYGTDQWDASNDLYGMMKFTPELEVLKEYIANYKINILQVQNINNLNNYTTGLREVFGMLKYSTDKNQMNDYITSNKERFTNLDEATYTAISILLDEKSYLNKIKEEVMQNEEGGYNMCLAFEQMREEARVEGRETGIEILILDNIEENIPKERILQKLQKRYGLSIDIAKEKYEKYSKELVV